MLEMDEIDMIVIGAPNDLHCSMTVEAARAGKHVVCEKPLCLNLAEADRMIEECEAGGVKLMYAEELCFAPKYVRLKQLLDSGALGKPILIKQSEPVQIFKGRVCCRGPVPIPAGKPVKHFKATFLPLQQQHFFQGFRDVHGYSHISLLGDPSYFDEQFL